MDKDIIAAVKCLDIDYLLNILTKKYEDTRNQNLEIFEKMRSNGIEAINKEKNYF
jgi:hypothetical protein